MPGISPVDVTRFLPLLSALPSLASTALPAVTLFGTPMLDAEAPLRCYLFRKGC